VEGKASQGAVYIFSRSENTWSEEAILTASDGMAEDRFGTSVAIYGDIALVGADYVDVGENTAQGIVYSFTRMDDTWSEGDKLIAPDGAENDHFGCAVDLFGMFALVGAKRATVDEKLLRGAAYLFYYSFGTWSPRQKLVASDGVAEDRFGSSVTIDNQILLVGAPYANVDDKSDQGAAYIFVPSPVTFEQKKKLTAPEGAVEDLFVFSVSLSGNLALIGAYKADLEGNADQGEAYLFEQSEGTWGLVKILTALDGAQEDFFGTSVAVEGATAMVGAYLANVGGNSGQGAAYLFAYREAVLPESLKLLLLE
jgi:hypothetical protein